MHDQPRSPTQVLPEATCGAGKLRDTDVIRCILELDEPVIAAERVGED